MIVMLTCVNSECSEDGIAKGPINLADDIPASCGVCREACERTPANDLDGGDDQS